MKPLPTSRGVAYCPDGSELSPPEQNMARAPMRSALVFVAVFIVLQTAWQVARGSWLEHLFIDRMTVAPAAAVVNLISPTIQAHADGARIRAPGGGLNILNGCEGTEVLMLLIAAFSSVPLSWRSRLSGMLLGILLVLVLNQARIIGLFYAFRADRPLFDLLHTTAAPLLLIAATGLYFYGWIYRDARRLAKTD